MITNDRQYKIAKTQVEEFEQSLDSLELTMTANSNIHPKIWEAQRAAIQSKLNELISEVEEYEALKSGKIAIAEINSIQELPQAIIKARIANGMTQAELAEKVGVKMQQIQRYESENYETASLKTLGKIAEQLNIKISADIQIRDIQAPKNLDAKNYPFKQMFQRKWFGNYSGSYNDAVVESKNLLEKFFENIGILSYNFGLNKRTLRRGSNLNEFALTAWHAQVLKKARNQISHNNFNKKIITESWLKSLAEISTEENGPLKAAEYVKNSGIRFVIEPHLEGTLLDGAALLLDSNSPVIAMTLRHDRLDNFWFVLFHEIAHIVLHLSETIEAIFDDLDEKIDGIEQEADSFALNALIPNEIWRKSLVRFSPSEDTIITQAKSLRIHPALIAGRIRRETGKYFQFSNLIGQGEVRKYFFHDFKN